MSAMTTVFTLSLSDSFFSMKLADFEECVEAVETLLVAEAAKFDANLKKTLDKMSGEQRDEYLDFVASDKLSRLQESFPQLLRVSLFLHSYSFFEHTLTQLANNLQVELQLNLAPKELRDDGIVRCQTYLKKVAAVGFPDNHPTWSIILLLNKIRNLYSHRDGVLPKDGSERKMVEDFVSKTPHGLRLNNEFDQIEIESKEFLLFVLTTFRDFWRELYQTVMTSSNKPELT